MQEMDEARIQRARTEPEIAACFPVLSQLRPHLEAASFVAQVRRMEVEGFRLCFLEVQGTVRAVAGYRRMEMLATGPVLYVDDLVTDAAFRSQGHGARLLQWLLKEAEANGCRYLELDSGTTRLDAHRFYERCGMEKVALHFSMPCANVEPWKSPALGS
jgi:GNAT superfamily N-acetyltransferase